MTPEEEKKVNEARKKGAEELKKQEAEKEHSMNMEIADETAEMSEEQFKALKKKKEAEKERKEAVEKKEQLIGVDLAKGSDKTILTEIEETCITCGCTEKDCKQCVEKTGKPCHWVANSKCSACFDEEGKPLEFKE